jgi:pyridoxine 4-dehydrogenase
MTHTSSDFSPTFNFGEQTSVHRMGFGAMRLTGQPGNLGPYAHWADGVALLRQAVELGVNFFDTAHSYGPVSNEELLGEALEPFGSQVFIATKAGVSKRANGQIIVDASAGTLQAQVAQSLKALRRERLDLVQLHRVDPNTPIEVSVMALERMREKGLIAHIGLSNVTQEQLDAARKVASIASIQNRYNMMEREHDDLIDYTASLGIAFIPYGPLGAHPMQPGAPLAQGNADSLHTPAQHALAWLLKRSLNMIVIPGTTRIAHLTENVQASRI